MKEYGEYFLRIRSLYEEGFSKDDIVAATPALLEDVEHFMKMFVGTESEVIRNISMYRKKFRAMKYPEVDIQNENLIKEMDKGLSALKIGSLSEYKNRYKAIIMFYLCNYGHAHTAKLLKEIKTFILDTYCVLEIAGLKRYREERTTNYKFTKKYMNVCRSAYSYYIERKTDKDTESKVFADTYRNEWYKHLNRCRALYNNLDDSETTDRSILQNKLIDILVDFENKDLKGKVQMVGEMLISDKPECKAIILYLGCVRKGLYLRTIKATPMQSNKVYHILRASKIDTFKKQLRGLGVLYLMSQKYNNSRIEKTLNCGIALRKEALTLLNEEYSMDEIIDAFPAFVEYFGEKIKSFYN